MPLQRPQHGSRSPARTFARFLRWARAASGQESGAEKGAGPALATPQPRPLPGDAGMFTLLTAAAAGGGAGATGGWAAARLALGTRLAVRRGVPAPAASAKAARREVADRLGASQLQSPAQRAFPRRRLAKLTVRSRSFEGERTETSQLPGELPSGARVPERGGPGAVELHAGVGREGEVGTARRPRDPRPGVGGAGRAAMEPGGRPTLSVAVVGAGGINSMPGPGSSGLRSRPAPP
jgi:hypothetical protein